MLFIGKCHVIEIRVQGCYLGEKSCSMGPNFALNLAQGEVGVIFLLKFSSHQHMHTQVTMS